MGGRSLSPIIRQQLENLDKDAESRKSAMKVLKSFVEDLDSKAIPMFLAQVSQTKDPNLSSREYTISLYEILARFHGCKIVPQIDNIMSSIVKTLMSSAGSFPLQQACSKVVPAIARYSIEPSTPEHEKPKIICSLCKPLSDILMGTPDCAASGSALCLKALVECENWRFASNEVVNEVCLKVAGALEEKHTQTNSHMGLAMTLANRNSLVIEAYARSITRSGIQMLTNGELEGNLHKRLTSIQMIKCLLKCVDSRSIFSELETIIHVMEKCQSDSMECVRGAASEALQAAKTVHMERGSTSTCSNFRRREFSRRKSSVAGDNLSTSGSRSPGLDSPESQTVHSFMEQYSCADSPLSIGQTPCNFEYSGPARRRLWTNETGGVDVSLKDGLFSEVGSCSSSCLKHFEDDDLTDGERDDSRHFSGFAQTVSTNVNAGSATPSPQRTSQLNVDDIRIYTTPRKLIHSLQDPDEPGSKSSENRKTRSPSCIERDMGRERNKHGAPRSLEYENNEGKVSLEGESSESLLSTSRSSYPPGTENCFSEQQGLKEKSKVQPVRRKGLGKTTVSLILGLSLVLPAVIFSAIFANNPDEAFGLVPT